MVGLDFSDSAVTGLGGTRLGKDEVDVMVGFFLAFTDVDFPAAGVGLSVTEPLMMSSIEHGRQGFRSCARDECDGSREDFAVGRTAERDRIRGEPAPDLEDGEALRGDRAPLSDRRRVRGPPAACFKSISSTVAVSAAPASCSSSIPLASSMYD
jgi:hypothetical protein